MTKFYNSFRIKNSVGNNLANDPDDVMAVKSAMTRMGRLRLDPDKAEPHGYLTRDLDQALKSYQKERGLRVDGIMFAGGETEKNLNYQLRQFIETQQNQTIEKEELPPPNIPGTNIPDRGVPEQGETRHKIQGDKDKWRYQMDSDIIKTPPIMDMHMEIPVIDELYGPWQIKGIGKKI
jgi:hypothetical protein